MSGRVAPARTARPTRELASGCLSRQRQLLRRVVGKEQHIGGLTTFDTADDHRSAIERNQEPVSTRALEVVREFDQHVTHPDRTEDPEFVGARMCRPGSPGECRHTSHKE